MKSLPRILAAALAALSCMTPGCVSTKSVGYSDGWVTTSPVSYGFVGPPVLSDMRGRTYRVEVQGAAGSGPIETFDQHGMRAATGSADVDVKISLGEVQQGEPGAMKLGKEWCPAFSVSVPYEISIRQRGKELASQRGVSENLLTFSDRHRFPTREQAVAAIDMIRKLGQKNVEERARNDAAKEARQRTNEVAAGLFEERNISMEVPVVRSAAGLDLEAYYTMLGEAQGPAQVQQALEAYERIGTDQRKPDGTPNQTANYGVACGIAASKLLLRDLRGAWDASKLARTFEPTGEEVDQICYVIYQQEKITGVRVIPEEDRAAIAQREQMAGALEKLFGAPGR